MPNNANTPGLYGPGPEFGENEIEFDHGSRGRWGEDIVEARKKLTEAKFWLAALKEEWEQDIHLKTGANECKSDELEAVEDAIQSVEDAIWKMREI